MEFIKKNIKLFCLIMLLIITILVIVLVNLNNNNDTNNSLNTQKKYIFDIFGDLEIKIKQGEEYIEPGYFAYYENINETKNVVVIGSVNTNKVGVYKINYIIGSQMITRVVEVVANEEIKDITFKLKGDSVITLKTNETYEELGVIAVDSNNQDLTNLVKIDNQIIFNQPGTYYVNYSINYNNQEYKLEREIIIVEPLKINLTYDNSFQREVEIKINVTGDNFKFLRLPDGVLSNLTSTSYKVSSNGIYNFYVYDKDGNYVFESVNITNIDNNIDSASCTLNVKVKSSSISIQAIDSKSGINYYKYNGVEYKSNTINLSSKVTSATIFVYDNALNYKSVTCKVNILEEIYGFILIGDSRFVAMETHLGSSKRSNDTIVAKGAQGWNWFLSTAIPRVNAILKANPDKKYYIMSNLGINDFKYHYSDANYGIKLSELASGDWSEHIVGYISVNPYASVSDSRNQKVVAFNERQKQALKGVYYCDTYNGIGLSNFKPLSSSDTTHYYKTTSKDIYNYVINNCSF